MNPPPPPHGMRLYVNDSSTGSLCRILSIPLRGPPVEQQRHLVVSGGRGGGGEMDGLTLLSPRVGKQSKRQSSEDVLFRSARCVVVWLFGCFFGIVSCLSLLSLSFAHDVRRLPIFACLGDGGVHVFSRFPSQSGGNSSFTKDDIAPSCWCALFSSLICPSSNALASTLVVEVLRMWPLFPSLGQHLSAVHAYHIRETPPTPDNVPSRVAAGNSNQQIIDAAN